MVDLLKVYPSAIIAFGFINFVIIRLFKNFNFKRKALVSLIVSAAITLIVVGIILFDALNNVFITFKDGAVIFFYYYSYLIVAILYLLILPLVLFLIGKSRHQRFRSFQMKKERVKPVYTVHESNEFVYAVIRYNGNYLLKQTNDSFTGIVERLNEKVLFHDEMIKKIISKYELNSEYRMDAMYNLVGEIKVIKKKDQHYYCYVVDIDCLNDKLSSFTQVSPYELMNYNLNDFDKQVLYRIILRDYFKIEIKEETK